MVQSRLDTEAPQRDADESNHAPHLQRWHPKITPYRLTVVLTTLGLGTAKAVLTLQGGWMAPITLEWISGVVVALSFHFANIYDNGAQAPRRLSWFFKFDCMDLAWQLLSLLSIGRPEYTSTELSSLLSTHPPHPPITLYRLLVSITALSFGMSKAALSYLGLSTAATWFDWFLVSIVATALYILGLYEFSSPTIWPFFFVRDWTSPVFLVLLIVLIAFFTSWTCFFTDRVSFVWNLPTLEIFTTGSPTFLDNFFQLNLNIFTSFCVAGFFCAYLAIGVIGLAVSVRMILPERMVSLLRRLFYAIHACIRPGDILPTHWSDSRETFWLIFIYIIRHLLPLAISFIVLFIILGFTFMATTMLAPTLAFVVGSLLVSLDLIFLWSIFTGICSLLRPFRLYSRPYPPEFYSSLQRIHV